MTVMQALFESEIYIVTLWQGNGVMGILLVTEDKHENTWISDGFGRWIKKLSVDDDSRDETVYLG